MEEQLEVNYARIAQSIEYIKNNFKNQPELDDIAKEVGLSPFHFQRLFTEWAGVSPKKFLQYVSISYVKDLLKESCSIAEATHEVGFSSTSRLHDLFIRIEGMTPGEYKNGGATLSINYSFTLTPFGEIIIASTTKGICYLSFFENKALAFSALQEYFPNALFTNSSDIIQKTALRIFYHDWTKLDEIKLHLKGTDFQLNVWSALLKIPMGNLSTYGYIAKNIGNTKAARAVGTAIGSNPIAFIIPCHRVIQATGIFGGYMWGPTRKTALIGWEIAKTTTSRHDL